MTGADFNYVLASAQGAESHFRWLKHLFLSYLLITLLLDGFYGKSLLHPPLQVKS